MSKESIFTHHAGYRTKQRCTLTQAQITQLLGFNLAVKIGESIGTLREYWLFYSPSDDAYFVVVQDKLGGAVITLSPLAYHEQRHDKVFQHHLDAAKALLPTVDTLTHFKLPTEPAKLHLSVTLDLDGQHKVKNIGTLNPRDCGCDPALWLESTTCKPIILKLLKEKAIDVNTVKGVVLRLVRNGDPIFKPFNELR